MSILSSGLRRNFSSWKHLQKDVVNASKCVSLSDNKVFHALWKSPAIYHDEGGTGKDPDKDKYKATERDNKTLKRRDDETTLKEKRA